MGTNAKITAGKPDEGNGDPGLANYGVIAKENLSAPNQAVADDASLAQIAISLDNYGDGQYDFSRAASAAVVTPSGHTGNLANPSPPGQPGALGKGVIQVNHGELRLTGGGTSSYGLLNTTIGDIGQVTTSKLVFASTFLLYGQNVFSGNGETSIDSGTLYLSDSVEEPISFVSDYALSFRMVSNSAIAGPGQFSVFHNFVWEGGIMGGAWLGDGFAGLTVFSPSKSGETFLIGQQQQATAVSVSERRVVSNGIMKLGTDLGNSSATLKLNDGAILVNNNNFAFSQAGSAVLSDSGQNGTFVDSAGARVLGARNGPTEFKNVVFQTKSAISPNSDLFQTQAIVFDQFCDITVYEGAVFTPQAGILEVKDPNKIVRVKKGGLLNGKGTINAPVVNSGTVAPGDMGIPGQFVILNDYSQTDGVDAGTYDVELDGLIP
jgi:hypothetical protein